MTMIRSIFSRLKKHVRAVNYVLASDRNKLDNVNKYPLSEHAYHVNHLINVDNTINLASLASYHVGIIREAVEIKKNTIIYATKTTDFVSRARGCK